MAGGQPRPNPTPPQRNRRTTGCTRTSRRASPSSCRPSDHPPDWATSRRLPSSRLWRGRHGAATPTQSFSTGLALQRLGHRLSARRQYDAAAKLAPRDPEALVAAAVARFDKSRPAEAFSRLGPLTRRFPRAPTVRFHLGLLLLWLARAQPGSVDEGKRQLRLAQAEDPGSPLATEAKRLLARLANEPKK